MALLSEAVREKEFDTRMLQRGMAKGLVTQEEIDKNQKKLADDAANVATTNLDEIFASVTSRKSGLR